MITNCDQNLLSNGRAKTANEMTVKGTLIKALAAATALIVGFFTTLAKADEIEIVADLFSASPVTLEAQAQNSSFEEYVRLHPEVRVRPFSSLRVTGAAARSGKLMAAAGGTPPDIWQMWFHETLKYSDQGFILPLNKYIFDRDGKVKYEPWNDIPQEFKVGCSKDGQIYALPVYTGMVQALNYRTDLGAVQLLSLQLVACARRFNDLYCYHVLTQSLLTWERTWILQISLLVCVVAMLGKELIAWLQAIWPARLGMAASVLCHAHVAFPDQRYMTA